jgi:hypothetical protein
MKRNTLNIYSAWRSQEGRTYFSGKSQGVRPLWNLCVNGRNILTQFLGKQVLWIELAQDTFHWRDFMNTLMYLWVTLMYIWVP